MIDLEEDLDSDTHPSARRPWGDDRILLEQFAIAACWSNSISARELIALPEQAWIREGHLTIVKAIKRVLENEYDINDMAVGVEVLRVSPEVYEHDFKSIHNLYADGVRSMDRLYRQALGELQQEFDWQRAHFGLKSALRKIRSLPFKDWYHKLTSVVSDLAPASRTKDVPTFNFVVRDRIAQHRSGEADLDKIETAIPELDHYMRGIRPGQMILLVGPPGMGKTTLAFQIAANLSIQNHKTLFNQLEMSSDEMADRAIVMAVKKDSFEDFSDEDWDKADRSADLLKNMTVFDEEADLEEWELQTRTWLYQNPDAAAVITDYAGLLQKHGDRVDPVRAASAVSAKSKFIAKKHRIAHILLQQPTKEYDNDKKPSLKHIRDSGKFRQDSDKILFLHHPHHWDKHYPDDYMELHVMKNRGGKAGVVAHLQWKPGWYIMRQWKGEIPDPHLMPKRQKDPAQVLRDNIKNQTEEMDLPL